MSQPIVEDKDKRIADLRSLLTQAKAKIDQYKSQLIQKEKDGDQLKKQYDKKIKMLEGDSGNIISQYQERLLRYQRSLEESNQLIQKHQKGMQYASKNYQQLLKKISGVHSITNKIFSSPSVKEKQTSDVVQQLCQLEKCKQFMQNIQKFGQIPDLDSVIKMLTVVVKNHQQSLQKRRQQRIQFVKKQTQLLKAIQQQKNKVKQAHQQKDAMRRQLTEAREKYQRNIESMAKNKVKLQQQKTNQEFIKQLMMKLITGPKDASIMALGILAKVLKMNQDEVKLCEKKIK